MSERQSIPPGQRWRVFARDNFTCRYCGARPPDVVLHCDHVHPVSAGGKNLDSNLVTACQLCNGGKGMHLMPEPKLPADKAGEAASLLVSVANDFPTAFDRLLDHVAQESGRLEGAGRDYRATILVMIFACLRMAAFLWLRREGDVSLREFVASARAAYQEEKDDVEKQPTNPV